MPVGAASFSEALRIGAEIFHDLKALLHERGSRPPSATRAASRRTSRRPRRRSRRFSRPPSARATRDRVAIALDVAATELLRTAPTGSTASRRRSSTGEMIELYETSPNATRSSRSRTGSPRTSGTAGQTLTTRLGDRVQLVGDDLFVTNVERLGAASTSGVANAILVKVNQIGTLTETLDAIELARAAGYAVDHLAPLGRDRGRDDRRPRGRDERRPDQDGRAVAHGPRRQVQPAAPDRGGARRRGRSTRLGRVPARSAAG